ncbi:MAG: chemotaxis protein CheD [Christensenellales bacterium]|jgi:chemotaxis protein CheD
MSDIYIGLSELDVALSPRRLITMGLGSCIGLVLYDPVIRAGGMAHIMLPSSPQGAQDGGARFADTAIPLLINRLLELGAGRARLVAKMAGGAHMFGGGWDCDVLKVGLRNAQKCRELLYEWRIPLIAEDTGGGVGRTLEFDCETGRLKIRLVAMKKEIII